MNVHDELKELSVEEIRTIVQEKAIPATVAMHNVSGNLNLGSIIRTANFLGFEEVLYYGRRKWDKRGAVGTYNYTKLTYFDTEEAFLKTILERGYNLVALENNVSYTSSLRSFVWPANPCIIVGEEESGLTETLLEQAYACVEIPARGSVRSLNVSAAAGMAMYDLTVKIGSFVS
jgi:tRNA G18 (ribose-2'-O)-methylase SpoU